VRRRPHQIKTQPSGTKTRSRDNKEPASSASVGLCKPATVR
jgi:hypothetical protein